MHERKKDSEKLVWFSYPLCMLPQHFLKLLHIALRMPSIPLSSISFSTMTTTLYVVSSAAKIIHTIVLLGSIILVNEASVLNMPSARQTTELVGRPHLPVDSNGNGDVRIHAWSQGENMPIGGSLPVSVRIAVRCCIRIGCCEGNCDNSGCRRGRCYLCFRCQNRNCR